MVSFYNKKVGAISYISYTLFFLAKLIGCYANGEAVFVNNITLRYKIASLIAHDKSKDKYTINDIGLNSRLDAL